MHALILFLILAPIVGSSNFTHDPLLGGGGAGPAGGGGGGMNATGSLGERLEFVRVKSDPTVMPKPKPLTVPPVKTADPNPVVESPVIPTPRVDSAVTTANTGGGSGNTGTAGAGPGSGGGVGSGVGPGRGSNIGPGTGGGPGKNYPPTLRDLFIPPLPAPDRIKPYHLIAWFDVDEKGNSRLISFNPSRDGGYNRRLEDVLRSLRFRPGVRADGTPMRDTVDVHFIF